MTRRLVPGSVFTAIRNSPSSSPAMTRRASPDSHLIVIPTAVQIDRHRERRDCRAGVSAALFRFEVNPNDCYNDPS